MTRVEVYPKCAAEYLLKISGAMGQREGGGGGGGRWWEEEGGPEVPASRALYSWFPPLLSWLPLQAFSIAPCNVEKLFLIFPAFTLEILLPTLSPHSQRFPSPPRAFHKLLGNFLATSRISSNFFRFEQLFAF